MNIRLKIFVITCILTLIGCKVTDEKLATEILDSNLQQTETSPLSTPLLLSTTVPTTEATRNSVEFLVVWGRQFQDRGSDCRLLILNPFEQTQQEFVNQGQDCNYDVMTIDGQQYLSSYPTFSLKDEREVMRLHLYALADSGGLIQVEEIVLEDIRITHPPQWDDKGFVYFSGIRADKEQIYRFDRETDTLIPYIDAVGGFSTRPVLSPNNRYIAYHVVTGHNSEDQCADLSCNELYHYIWDTVTEEGFALLPMIEPFIAGEPYYSHCDLAWSSTGQYIAFNVGCGLQLPESIVIVDVTNQQPVEIFNATRGLRKTKWLSDDTIAIIGEEEVVFSLTNDRHEGYLLYSVNEKAWTSLSSSTTLEAYLLNEIYHQDWIVDGTGMLLLGTMLTQAGNQEPVNQLVILGVPQQEFDKAISYISLPDEGVGDVNWSLSGELIMYRSYDWERRGELSRFSIVDRTGKLLIDTGLLEIIFPKFSWLSR